MTTTPDTARPRPTAPPRVLVTAGPTHEPIDEVRFIGNRSSGRMGIAIARAAADHGLPVTLLLGPVERTGPDDSRIDVRRFRTTADLGRLLSALWPEHDILFMAAAVADFAPEGGASAGKLGRSGSRTLTLEPTPDLLAGLTEHDHHGTVIGFALEEPQRLEDAARAKCAAKRCAAIVANPLRTMDAESVSGTLIFADGRRHAPGDGGRAAEVSKEDFAQWLLGEVLTLHRAP